MHCPDLSEPHKTTSPNWRQANSKLCQFNEAHLLTVLQTLLTRHGPIQSPYKGRPDAEATLLLTAQEPFRSHPFPPRFPFFSSHFSSGSRELLPSPLPLPPDRARVHATRDLPSESTRSSPFPKGRHILPSSLPPILSPPTGGPRDPPTPLRCRDWSIEHISIALDRNRNAAAWEGCPLGFTFFFFRIRISKLN